ncbi:sensor histidine kinase [Nanoarchaeota archaeon]
MVAVAEWLDRAIPYHLLLSRLKLRKKLDRIKVKETDEVYRNTNTASNIHFFARHGDPLHPYREFDAKEVNRLMNTDRWSTFDTAERVWWAGRNGMANYNFRDSFWLGYESFESRSMDTLALIARMLPLVFSYGNIPALMENYSLIDISDLLEIQGGRKGGSALFSYRVDPQFTARTDISFDEIVKGTLVGMPKDNAPILPDARIKEYMNRHHPLTIVNTFFSQFGHRAEISDGVLYVDGQEVGHEVLLEPRGTRTSKFWRNVFEVVETPFYDGGLFMELWDPQRSNLDELVTGFLVEKEVSVIAPSSFEEGEEREVKILEEGVIYGPKSGGVHTDCYPATVVGVEWQDLPILQRMKYSSSSILSTVTRFLERERELTGKVYELQQAKEQVQTSYDKLQERYARERARLGHDVHDLRHIIAELVNEEMALGDTSKLDTAIDHLGSAASIVTPLLEQRIIELGEKSWETAFLARDSEDPKEKALYLEELGRLQEAEAKAMEEEATVIGSLSNIYRTLAKRTHALQNAGPTIYKLKRMVDAFSRQEDLTYDPKRIVDVGQLIRDIASREIYRDIQFTVDVDPNLVFYGDDRHYEEVLKNLVGNGVDAARESGKETKEIKISTYAQDGKPHLAVEDNGVGIPEEDREKVFGSFYTTKDRDKGSGRGLDIVDSIVNAYNARIKIESEVGVFTRFTISYETRINRPVVK